MTTMTRPSANPFAIPKPPPSVARTVKPSQITKERAWLIPVHWKSYKAIAKGTKSCVIVPFNETTWPQKVKTGHRMRFIAKYEPTKPALDVEAVSVCRHANIGDIPACEIGHEPDRILPHAPTWVEVLHRAAVGGAPGKETGSMDDRGRQGWVVVEYRPLP